MDTTIPFINTLNQGKQKNPIHSWWWHVHNFPPVCRTRVCLPTWLGLIKPKTLTISVPNPQQNVTKKVKKLTQNNSSYRQCRSTELCQYHLDHLGINLDPSYPVMDRQKTNYSFFLQTGFPQLQLTCIKFRSENKPSFHNKLETSSKQDPTVRTGTFV